MLNMQHLSEKHPEPRKHHGHNPDSDFTPIPNPGPDLQLRQDGGVLLGAEFNQAPPEVVAPATQLRRVLLRARAAQLLLLAR